LLLEVAIGVVYVTRRAPRGRDLELRLGGR